MSYDLYFRPRSGKRSADELLEHFRDRPNFTLEDGRAVYENEYTGTTFMFEKHESEPGSPDARYTVDFNINFFRPSYFVHEAEREVSAFVRRFDCLVFDPQTDNADSEYRRERFISDWSHGNEVGVQAMLKARPGWASQIRTLPGERLMKVWRWNYEVPALQAQQKRDVFVSRIFLIEIDGRTATMSIWADGLPVILSSVDYLVVARKRVTPRRAGEANALVYTPWNQMRPLLERHGSTRPDGTILVDYDSPPPDLIDFISLLQPEKHDARPLQLGEVLDQELVDKAKAHP